jgi:2-iminobutanoate/2-iminopropanoate deaminase
MQPVDSERIAVHAPDAPAALGPYNHAVMTAGLVFCSGQLPLDPSTGQLVGNDAAEQTAQCLRNLETICAQAGTSLTRSVRLTLFLTDLADFDDVNKVYATFFEGSPPARVAVQVAALAGGAKIEIDAIAVV